MTIIYEELLNQTGEEFSLYLKKRKFSYEEFIKNSSKKTYNSLLRKLIHENSKIPNDKLEIINLILKDCLSIYKSLLPLYLHNIHFSLSLSGGAVRDLLLGNHHKIKDLDLVLSIHKIKIPTVKEMYQSWGFDSLQFHWLALPQINHSNNLAITEKEKTYHIIKHLISKHHSLLIDYAPRGNDDGEKSEYLVKDLNGVIKINTPTLHYPVDLLITNSKIDSFIEKFDFNICKASISLVKDTDTKFKDFFFPKNATEFLKELKPTKGFLHDAKNKNITMDMNFRSVSDINTSIEKHLPRIIEKYPTYNLKFPLDEGDISLKEKESIILHYNMNKKILEKESNKTINHSIIRRKI